MRRSSAPLRQIQPRAVERASAAWPIVAFFSAFALIAAIAFGTTSVHPF
ncbi:MULTISPECIES: hypothetical protein [unclassified Bradyrhizobium]|nr:MULTISPECIES: hypothetical protein [unclassified Bradyrhizobium]